MATITKHSKERIIERTEGVGSVREAKQCAKLAWSKGKPIGYFKDQPKFQAYLKRKKKQSHSCHIRVYKDCIYIWRGKNNTLITALTIPEVFKEVRA